MHKILSITLIKFFMNLLLIIFLIQSLGIIFTKSYELFFKADEIDILRVELPWYNPINDVTIMLDKSILQNDPALLQRVNKNIFIYDLIGRIVFLSIMFLILLQLKKLLIVIRGKTFFELPNILLIRNLSILVGMWVLSYFIMYQIMPIFVPVELITDSINFTTINEFSLDNILIAIDFKMLFVAIFLYVISISFKDGYQLKEQTALTI